MSTDDPNTPNSAKGGGPPKDLKLDVRAESAEQVRVDASEKLSYKDYAAMRKEPVITVQRIIDRRAKPPEPKKTLWPNMEIKQVVIWGELPKEEPPKPERAAATIKSYILHTPPAPKPPPKGIGSMDPPGS